MVAAPARLTIPGWSRKIWALLRRSREQNGAPCINPKRVYRVMREHQLLQRRPGVRRDKRRHDGRVAVDRSNTRWCSDGYEFRCDDGTPLRVTFALDCCDREAISWAATTGGHGGDVVRDVMLAAVEQRFGTPQAAQPIEWLSDNGSAYIDHRTRKLGENDRFDFDYMSGERPDDAGSWEFHVFGMRGWEEKMGSRGVERAFVPVVSVLSIAQKRYPLIARPIAPIDLPVGSVYPR
ncbi:transposase [Burkholderia thailandensis E264]|uniref:Transposase n=1 Tax=Burkholderia thailandensis (strain ATCC 700388 / DSM 13276 / CCUG 48851 / CIP 106301 / E264) TaxID=271848 RepID=Q2T7D5_BURTA|nr:transposase [Burkholderia thailandensis E264]